MATTVTLEKCGHNVGYKGLDNCRFCPGSQCCVEGGPECIDSVIDMDTVCKRVSALGLDVTVTISKDAGRYGMPVIAGENNLILQHEFPSCSTHETRTIHTLFTAPGADNTSYFPVVTQSSGETREIFTFRCCRFD